jgi:O-antigen/teichoic acid export membrane protein
MLAQESSLQLRVRHIARNVLFNWLGTIVNMAVGFFLSPFILHRLGNVAYGVWVITVSLVGYLALLDLGMQGSVLRFVSQGYTKGDHKSASEATSAALWVRLQISLLALLLSVGLAAVFPHIFKKVPADLTSDAREAILIIAATTAVTMTFGVMGGIISALNRFDLQNASTLLQTAIRAIGITFVLHTGHGIVAIAVCEFFAALASKLLQVWIARRLYPELRIQLKRPSRETLSKIWSYSAYTFLITIAVRLVYQTDNLVVGASVSTAAVAFYAIANTLCTYAGQMVNAMSGTFMPAASTYQAAGNAGGLLMLYKNGTRAMILFSAPMMITLIFRGSSFIGLWMGPQYAHSSGIVLVVLCIPLFLSFANQTASAIGFGIEKHKTMAMWAVGEGVANLALSIILARWYGIYGVAIGTLVPSLFVQLGFWPRYISRLVGLSTFEVLWSIWGPVFLASVPFAIATCLIEIFFPARSLIQFLVQVVLALPIFLGTVAIIFRGFVQSQILPRVRTKLAPLRGTS